MLFDVSLSLTAERPHMSTWEAGLTVEPGRRPRVEVMVYYSPRRMIPNILPTCRAWLPMHVQYTSIANIHTVCHILESSL